MRLVKISLIYRLSFFLWFGQREKRVEMKPGQMKTYVRGTVLPRETEELREEIPVIV